MKPTIWKKRGEVALGAIVIASGLFGGLLYKGAHEMWGDHAGTFFKGILKNPLRVGCISPCSKFVGKEIVKYVAQEASAFAKATADRADTIKPLRILEVGGGSGALTDPLRKALEESGASYCLDVLEIDPEYCKVLRLKFVHDENIMIYCVDAATWQPGEKYDFIISSIPFMSLDADIVRNIINNYQTLIKPNGMISYIEHMLFPQIAPYFMNHEKREDYFEKKNLIADFREQFKFETAKVWLNVTPLYVHHLKF